MQYKGYEFEEVDVSEWMRYDADKQAAYHEWLQYITFGGSPLVDDLPVHSNRIQLTHSSVR